MTSASLVDFYQRLWRNPDLSEHHQIRLARRLTLTYGALVIVLAFFVKHLGTLLEASNTVISLVGGPLLGLFFLGVLVRRATARGALVGWAAGVAVLMPIGFLTRTSFLWFAMVGCLTTMAVGFLVSLLEPAPPEEKTDGLTWSSLKVSEREPADQPA